MAFSFSRWGEGELNPRSHSLYKNIFGKTPILQQRHPSHPSKSVVPTKMTLTIFFILISTFEVIVFNAALTEKVASALHCNLKDILSAFVLIAEKRRI